MDSPKLKNISIRVKRTQQRTNLDEVRDQVSMKRCTVRLQRYNDEELRQMAIIGSRVTPFTDETNKPKTIRNMVVRVRRIVGDFEDGILVQ